ncbi:MAG: hypothetical protein ACP5NY_04070 [Thermocladium sp.]
MTTKYGTRHRRTGFTKEQWRQVFREAVKYCQANAPKGERKKCIRAFLENVKARAAPMM